jgi:tetratricopeptide (TPR) repeat protein
MAHLLRAHVALSQVDKALADMAALEKAGGGSSLTDLYYRLGKLLETEMDALQKRGDRAGLERMKTAYAKFLAAVVNSKTGQTVESLEWAGANMLKLGRPEEAEAVFNRLLKMFETDPKLSSRPDVSKLILLTRLRLAAALRGQRKFGEAESLVAQLVQENPKTVEPLMEKGFLLEDEAAAGKAKWASAFAHWRTLALRLGAGRTKPVDYYEAWYHAALALKSDNKPVEAKQTLASIMRLSPAVGGPEMKQKYQALLSQIK